MTMMRVDLPPAGAGRVVKEHDVIVIAGMRPLLVHDDEARYSLAELVEGQVERSASAVAGGPWAAS